MSMGEKSVQALRIRPLECSVGRAVIRIEYADLTTIEADALVSSDDVNLSMGGGVSASLLHRGGQRVWKEARQKAPVRLGEVAVTTAGALQAKRIFHAAVLDYDNRALTTVDIVRTVTKKCLLLCEELQFQSIAFPALAAGVASLDPEHSAVAILMELVRHLSGNSKIRFVTIALYPRSDAVYLDGTIELFYKYVSDFIEVAEDFRTIDAALTHLESTYRDLKSDEPARRIALVRNSLQERREIVEQEGILPGSFSNKNARFERAAIPDALLELEANLPDLAKLIRERADSEYWERYALDTKVVYERALQICRRNLADLEVESARGFSVQIKRQMEFEQERILKLQERIREFQNVASRPT